MTVILQRAPPVAEKNKQQYLLHTTAQERSSSTGVGLVYDESLRDLPCDGLLKATLAPVEV